MRFWYLVSAIIGLTSLLVRHVQAASGTFVGGFSGEVYMLCDDSWKCTGTHDKEQATVFEEVGDQTSTYYPYNQYRRKGTSPALCLNVLGYNIEVGLTTCTPGTAPPDNELFRTDVHQGPNNTPIYRVVNKYDGDKKFWWQGDNVDIVVAEVCTDSAWQCYWRFVPE
jgi:hypothetical protein